MPREELLCGASTAAGTPREREAPHPFRSDGGTRAARLVEGDPSVRPIALFRYSVSKGAFGGLILVMTL